MNLPICLVFAFTSGLLAALAGRVELRATPRAAFATDAFRAFAAFLGLLVLPVTTYFYGFHGDWFLAYAFDSSRIPSAVGMVGLLLLAGLGALGFAAGTKLVRAQRESLGAALVVAAFSLSGTMVAWLDRRFTTVGTYSQFHGEFGVTSWTRSPLLPSVALSAVLLVVGLGYCTLRTNASGRRNSGR